MNYTSIEQSKHLLELGLKPGTCDKVWVSDKGAEVEFTMDLMDEEDYNKYVYTYPNDMYIPCWSAGALLELIGYDYYMETSPKYHIFDILCDLPEHTEHKECGNTLLEAAYNMIVWLLQNNYIEKGE